jgi:nucleoside-diphosphate-sugar epimerase
MICSRWHKADEEARLSRVLLTGATGFVGRALCGHLAQCGYTVRAALRSGVPLPQGATEGAVVGDMSGQTDWASGLSDVDFVVHAAGRAHMTGADGADEARFMEVNANAARRLADAAGHAGVRRLVYVSSIKVNGERTEVAAFSAADRPDPQDAYARSKLRAEELLWQVSTLTGMEVAIVRPPLVYGSGVHANFLRLLSWVDGGRPLPFGSIRNRRSLVSVWNLSSLIVSLLAESAAAGRTWLVSDGEDLSTAQLTARLARALGRPVRLLSVPVPLLRLGGALSGRSGEVARLCDSLAVNIDHTRALLRWRPPYSVDDCLRRTAAWYRRGNP